MITPAGLFTLVLACSWFGAGSCRVDETPNGVPAARFGPKGFKISIKLQHQGPKREKAATIMLKTAHQIKRGGGFVSFG